MMNGMFHGPCPCAARCVMTRSSRIFHPATDRTGQDRTGQDNTNSPPHPCVNATGHRPQNAVEIVPVMVKRGSTMKELPFALRPPLAP